MLRRSSNSGSFRIDCLSRFEIEISELVPLVMMIRPSAPSATSYVSWQGPCREKFHRFFHRRRVIGADRRPFLHQLAQDGQRWASRMSFVLVLNDRPRRRGFSLSRLRRHPFTFSPFAGAVRSSPSRLRQRSGTDTLHVRRFDQRREVFRESRTRRIRAGMQKFVADPVVEPHAFRHQLDVCAHLSHTVAISLINEILTARKALDAYLIISAVGMSVTTMGFPEQIQGTVEVLHDGDGLLAVRADDDAVRPHKVFDGGAFPQKFRIDTMSNRNRPV